MHCNIIVRFILVITDICVAYKHKKPAGTAHRLSGLHRYPSLNRIFVTPMLHTFYKKFR
jgi:hypothetical protein